MTAVSFIVPFLAFLPAEEAEASGVVAVVVAGLVTGHHGARTFTARERLTERTNWLTLQFLVENGVFLLMGLQLESLLRDLDESNSSRARGAGHRRPGARPAARAAGRLRRRPDPPRTATADPARRVRQRLARDQRPGRHDVAGARTARDSPSVASAGCRSSAAGSSAAGPTSTTRRASRSPPAAGPCCRGPGCAAWSRSPPRSPSAPEVEERTLLITVAFVVAVVSLLLYGGTLPLLIRVLGVSGVDPDRQRDEVAELLGDITATAVAAMGPTDRIVIDGRPIDPDVAKETLSWLERVRDARSDRRPEGRQPRLAADAPAPRVHVADARRAPRGARHRRLQHRRRSTRPPRSSTPRSSGSSAERVGWCATRSVARREYAVVGRQHDPRERVPVVRRSSTPAMSAHSASISA